MCSYQRDRGGTQLASPLPGTFGNDIVQIVCAGANTQISLLWRLIFFWYLFLVPCLLLWASLPPCVARSFFVYFDVNYRPYTQSKYGNLHLDIKPAFFCIHNFLKRVVFIIRLKFSVLINIRHTFTYDAAFCMLQTLYFRFKKKALFCHDSFSWYVSSEF